MGCSTSDLGVINGRYQLEMRRPLFPRKQTWIGPARAGKLGEFQRFSPGGLFGLSFNFLRMNQAHRSASPSRQRFVHPPPDDLTGEVAAYKKMNLRILRKKMKS